MDTSGVIQLIILIVLVFLSAFFSSAETAFSTVNRVRMRTLEEEGNKKAARVNKILDNYGKMISTILIGNNIVNIAASALATTLALRINLMVGIATGILTIVVLLFGEIIPKTWAKLYNEPIALTYSSIILLLMKLLTPVIIIVDLLANVIMKLLHIDPNKKAGAMTESELKDKITKAYVIDGEEVKITASQITELERYLNKYDLSSDDCDFISAKIDEAIAIAQAGKAKSFTELTSEEVAKMIAIVSEVNDKTSVKANLTKGGKLTIYEQDGSTPFTIITDKDNGIKDTNNNYFIIVIASAISLLGVIVITKKVSGANA